MHLAEWLKLHRRTHDEFGSELGVTHTAVGRYVNGTRMPKRAIMLKIQEITGGAVTPNDFFGPPEDDDALPPDTQPVVAASVNGQLETDRAA